LWKHPTCPETDPAVTHSLFLNNKNVTSSSGLKFWAFFFVNFEAVEVFET
jgi:hypothetical protein